MHGFTENEAVALVKRYVEVKKNGHERLDQGRVGRVSTSCSVDGEIRLRIYFTNLGYLGYGFTKAQFDEYLEVIPDPENQFDESFLVGTGGWLDVRGWGGRN